MKIGEDYAQRKVDEKLEERNEEIVRNMDDKGLSMEDIVVLAKVSRDFVEKHYLNKCLIFHFSTN